MDQTTEKVTLLGASIKVNKYHSNTKLVEVEESNSETPYFDIKVIRKKLLLITA